MHTVKPSPLTCRFAAPSPRKRGEGRSTTIQTRMTSLPVALPRPEWSRLVADSLRQHGSWHTYLKLVEARNAYPADLARRGYVEIVRNTIVRELIGNPRGMQAVPRLSAAFLTNFDRFNLSAQEGY